MLYYKLDLSDVDLSNVKTLGVGYMASSSVFRHFLTSKYENPKLLGGSTDKTHILRKLNGVWKTTNMYNGWVPSKFYYSAPDVERSLRFVCCSDIHFDQAGEYKMTANDDTIVISESSSLNVSNLYRMQRLVDALNEEHEKKPLDFVIFNGDIITLHDKTWSNPSNSAPDSLRMQRLRLFKEKYLSQLKMPYYVMRGNHDEYLPEEWKEVFGNDVQFSVETEDYKILCIDTYKYLNTTFKGPGTSNSGIDLNMDWIDSEIEKAKADNKKVVGVLHDLQHSVVPAETDRIFYEKYCREDSVLQFLVSGHYHKSQTLPYGSKPVYYTGSFGHIPNGSTTTVQSVDENGNQVTTTTKPYDYPSSERFGFRVFEMGKTGYQTYFCAPRYNYDWTDKLVSVLVKTPDGKTVSRTSTSYSLDKNGEYVEGTRPIEYEGEVLDAAEVQYEFDYPFSLSAVSGTKISDTETKISFNILKNKIFAKNAKVYIAVYDNLGRLKSVESAEIPSSLPIGKTLVFAEDIVSEYNGLVKVFVWQGTTPVSSTSKLELRGNLSGIRTIDDKDRDLRVAFVSDTHYNNEYNLTSAGTDNSRFEILVNSLNEEHRKKPFDFVVINGDLVTIKLQDVPTKLSLLEDFVDKYLSRLEMPWYAIRGNHDAFSDEDWLRIMGNEPQLCLDTASYSFLLIDAYKYSKENLLYSGADLNYSGIDAQLDWIKPELERINSEGKRAICVYHYLNSSDKYDTEWKGILENNPDILAQVMGHSHVVYTGTAYGKTSIGTGNFGNLPSNNTSKSNGFGYKLIEMENDKLTVRHVYPEITYPEFPVGTEPPYGSEVYVQPHSETNSILLERVKFAK